ncbi:MAG: bifunctional riboflavin kinase/FAD synthetase [Verrucomicrobia bacterium]|nr:bifunctional riboflavin kinase/FAD synthetase [Verrucomicrobiota bacterium]
MITLRHAQELKPGNRPCCVAIGMFDGVHLGHQQVIRQAVTDAEQREGLAVVVTFDLHPAAVVAPERAPQMIHSLPQRMRALAALGVEAAWLIHFDREFSQQTAADFIRNLARDWNPLGSVCVGRDFSFGRQRSGNVKLLRELGEELGFTVHGLAAVALDGQTVSSTRIREAIRAGHLDTAQQMMGREYALAGAVVEGDRLGRQLGFPTANIEAGGLVLPPGGVYAVHAKDGEAHYRGLLNIGHRPTLQQPTPQLRVEAHLLDFEGDLYGRELEITFVDKLREERKFPSLEGLRQQIAQDVAEARLRFAAAPH